jgi:hypothetical protein
MWKGDWLPLLLVRRQQALMEQRLLLRVRCQRRELQALLLQEDLRLHSPLFRHHCPLLARYHSFHSWRAVPQQQQGWACRRLRLFR